MAVLRKTFDGLNPWLSIAICSGLIAEVWSVFAQIASFGIYAKPSRFHAQSTRIPHVTSFEREKCASDQCHIQFARIRRTTPAALVLIHSKVERPPQMLDWWQAVMFKDCTDETDRSAPSMTPNDAGTQTTTNSELRSRLS
jgi:hypothetical protein